MDPRSNRFAPMDGSLKGFFDKVYEPGDERPCFRIGETFVLRGYEWRVKSCEGSELVLEGVGLTQKAKKRLEAQGD